MMMWEIHVNFNSAGLSENRIYLIFNNLNDGDSYEGFSIYAQ